MHYFNSFLSGVENKFYGYNPSYISKSSEESAEIIQSFSQDAWHEIFKNLSFYDCKNVCFLSKKMKVSLLKEFPLCPLLLNKISPYLHKYKNPINQEDHGDKIHIILPNKLISESYKLGTEEAIKNKAEILIWCDWKIQNLPFMYTCYFCNLKADILNNDISSEQKNNINKIIDFINTREFVMHHLCDNMITSRKKIVLIKS